MKKSALFFLLLFFLKTTCCGQSAELAGIKASLHHISDSLRYVDALNRLAMLMYEKNIDSTFYYTKLAREIAERKGYLKGETDAVDNLGVFFDVKGDLQLGLRYYNEAYTGYTQLHDQVNRVQSLMNLASVDNEIGKDQRSIQEFNMALNIGKKLPNDSIVALVIYDYLLAFPKRFSRDSMRYYIDEATRIAEKYKDERVLVAIEQLVADDMIARGKPEQGLALLDKAIGLAFEKKLYYVSMDILIDMGDRLASTNPARAANYYNQGLDISYKNSYLFYSELMARKLFDLYAAHGDNQQAAIYSRRFIILHDELDKLNTASGIDYLDYALKEQQVKSLMNRSKYQAAFLIGAAIACLLAIVVIMVFRNNLKRTNRLNEQVTGQNEQMKKTLAALEQSQEDNSRMMKIAAHDLRNPINAMSSLAIMMLNEPDRSEDDREMLEMIKVSAQNSLALVDDLLQVQFKVEELEKQPVDIGEMLRYCVSLLSSRADAKGQQINLQTQEVSLPASGEKLWRVFSNLIGNAIKFNPVGAVIDIKMTLNAKSILIAVKDQGIGIPPEMQDKIFDMFTEAKRTGTAGEQSVGLGLAISRQIVEAHGGKIWFESIPGKGSTFFVDLPFEGNLLPV